jgi:hypothetical protein
MYRIFCTPALHYPLPVSNITKRELKSMQKNLLNTFKLKMKFRSNLADSIMFGPRRWCGLSLRESCFEQGLGHFKMLFGHLRENKSAVSAIHACLITLQLEMGLVTPIISSAYSTYSIVCLEGWTKTTWKFIADSKITVMTKFWTPNLLRESDTSLMGHVDQHRDELTRAQVLGTNRCRVYLQVISIADVTSNYGRFLLKSYYLGTAAPTRHWLQWPRQMKLRKQDWEQWRRALKMFLGSITTIALSSPLGMWFKTPPRPTTCYQKSAPRRLYVKSITGWECHLPRRF